MTHCCRDPEQVFEFAASDDLTEPPTSDDRADRSSRQPAVFAIVGKQDKLGLPS
jgi:hypothetical protein